MNKQIHEEASEWFTRMRDGEDSPAVRSELMTWFRQSPEHVRAYLDIAAVWMETKNVDADSELDLQTRIRLARADTEVVSLTEPLAFKAQDDSTSRKSGGLAIRHLAIAASLLITIMGGLFGAWLMYGPQSYATGLGEQRSIPLADGSTLDLNSDSRVRVRIDERQRTVDLLRGQALFRVAKDPKRPFVVRADKASVRAVGTVFDVHRKAGGAIVTVVEGSVIIERLAKHSSTDASVSVLASSPDAPLLRISLTAGKQVTVGQGTAAPAKTVNVAAATAWTQRKLIFESTPLAEVAEEFNRYNARRLIVEGDSLRSFKISAMFRTTDPASLVLYLRTIPDVRIDETDSTIRIVPAGLQN
jgi:transmembrane sensor